VSADLRPLSVVRSEDQQQRALEAVRPVAAEYGIATGVLKPCVAFLLDGNVGGAGRHDAAFVIAIECRRIALTESEAETVLRIWAPKIGYRTSEARRAIRSAYAKKKDGSWKYYPPGVTKKPGSLYDRVLGPICADVGCPANCAPFSNVHRGLRNQGYGHFEHLGWPRALRRIRHAAAADFYRAVCELESERGFAAGAPLFTSYAQLAALAGRDHRHAGNNLDLLLSLGLLRVFERGSGSGPKARDRVASRLVRFVPIPPVPPDQHPQYKTDGRTPPRIAGDAPADIGGGRESS
jgi:hypothetical protein